MKKILIVDDSLMMRHMLKEIVEKEGYTVAEASNGEEAIQKYKITKPDLVTMDITMPEMNGIQALLELKKIDENVKVIMVSAMGQKPMVIEAIKYGAKDFLVKPFETDKFISSIKKVIA
ncbi:response regulator [Niallia sp. JL1B1071]|uniref:response regulator n=1 Tax=Niallia tiangongensis TaxID=3237105 RepID=UPI0037DD3FB7